MLFRSKEETLAMIDQLIQKEMVRSGRTYKEVSQEFRRKLKEKMGQKNNYQMTKYLSKAHQEATEQKMKSVAQYQKSPKNWDKIDKQIQEHFEDHNQVNPNKRSSEKTTAMEHQIKPDWITPEQWEVNPNIHHWESSRKAMESLKQSKPVPQQQAKAQFSRLRNSKNWNQGA